MTMQTAFHSSYMGANIYRQWGGYALPYTAWIDGKGIRDGMAGKGDSSFTFMQRALWLQTGDCPALLP